MSPYMRTLYTTTDAKSIEDFANQLNNSSESAIKLRSEPKTAHDTHAPQIFAAGILHLLFGDVFYADEARALELEHDLVERRAAGESRHRRVGAVAR